MLDLIVVGVILADPLQEPLHSDTLAPLLRRAAGVPVLLFTSAAVGADEARAVGFAGVVNKPYDSESLLEAVRAAGRQAAEYAGPPRRAPRGFRPEEAVRAD
jgi:DNA-binding response OmpR family regulator